MGILASSRSGDAFKEGMLVTKIAFFSDDDAGALCGRMLCLGLSALHGDTTLALAGAAPAAGGAGAPGGTSVVALAPNANAFEVERAARAATTLGGDFVAALPLTSVRDRALRNQFDAVVTVGFQEASASRALRAARYLAAEDAGAFAAAPPAWVLAGPGQSELRTRAQLASAVGPRLPFATRALPMALPWLSPAERRRLAAWEADATVIRTGMLLAALALCVAADPGARRLEAADLATLMAARTLPAELALSDRLVGLANAYEELDAAVEAMGWPRHAACAPGRRALPARVGATHARRSSDGEPAGIMPRRA